jgi:hypothetical protein
MSAKGVRLAWHRADVGRLAGGLPKSNKFLRGVSKAGEAGLGFAIRPSFFLIPFDAALFSPMLA